MSVLIFILILSFLVLIHELGHFFAARKAGIKVEEFGLGYPPQALKLFTWKKTIFSLNWIPFGGFVRIEGEDELGGKFQTYSAGKRLSVILAGAIVNFIFGVLAFSLVFSVAGIPHQLEKARIGQVVPDSPAAEAGLEAQTNIVAFTLNDEHFAMENTQAVIDFVDQHQGQEVGIITVGPCQGLECEATRSTHNVYLRSADETPENEGSMGIVFQAVIPRHYPWYEMPFRGTLYGLDQAFWLGQMILTSLGELMGDLLRFESLPQELAGPVGIVHQASTQGLFEEGWLTIISFSGMLSINLAVLNLLPIPALDGGRAVFILFGEIVGGKKGGKKLEKIEHWANYAGYIFLLGLIILVTIRDVGRLFNFN